MALNIFGFMLHVQRPTSRQSNSQNVWMLQTYNDIPFVIER